MAKKKTGYQENVEAEKQLEETWPTPTTEFLDSKFNPVKEVVAVVKLVNDRYFIRVKSGRVYNPFGGSLDGPLGPDYNVSQFPWKEVDKRTYTYYAEFLRSKDSSKLAHTERIING